MNRILQFAALTLVLAAPVIQPASSAASRGVCVMGGEDRVQAAGDGGEEEEDEGAPPRFSRGFYRHAITLEASLDGMSGRELPISIEGICGVSRAHAREAMQLAGADGVALVYRRTAVFEGSRRLAGDAAAAALGGADTATLRVKLASPRSWREDEDGAAVPTFKTLRAQVTD